MANVGCSQGRSIIAAFFSKLRFSPPPTHHIRRGVHASAYEKNVEEEVAPSVIPDNIIQPDSDKYWAPHPETGVFGPETDIDPATFQANSTANVTEDSVLEQQTFFRPQEDLEIPVDDMKEPNEP